MPLRVVRIQYGSPGELDLLGIGKAAEQVRLFVEHIIDLLVDRRKRAAQVRGLEEENVGNGSRTLRPS
jgi:hypothetical protein